MVTAPTRRVRRLQLHAPTGAQARRGALLIEDALRTASLPIADQGRLVVVRRLDLGVIDPAAPASRVALQLEDAFRRLHASAVSFDSPAAAAADAVFFADALSALIALVRRFARHQPLDGWFWRSAVPGWEPHSDRPHHWGWLIERSLDHPTGPAALVAEALAADALDELFVAMSPSFAAAALHRMGVSNISVPIDATAPGFSVAARTWLTLRLRAAPELDERVLFLATQLALAHQPTLAADPHLPGRVIAALLHWGPSAIPSALAPFFPPTSSRKPSAASRPIGRGRQPGEDPRAPAGSSPGQTFLAPEPDAPPADPADEVPISPVTSHAGLLFLIPLLRRLGFEARLATNPVLLEAAFPARLLLHVGERLGLDRQDPLAIALRSLFPEEPPPAELPFAPWVSALRKACRRLARVHLGAIVRRPGRLCVAPANLDLTFAPAQADLRLRRAGLDLDPGWIPWLGLVVRYHYSDAS